MKDVLNVSKTSVLGQEMLNCVEICTNYWVRSLISHKKKVGYNFQRSFLYCFLVRIRVSY